MKYLKIDKGFAYFSKENDYVPIEDITKEDLMNLINCVVDDSVNFEMDDYESNEINNPAHKIIYSNLYNKLMELNTEGNRFKDESESIYLEAKIKYSISE